MGDLKIDDICYYCGDTANDGRQHIPMKGFFPEKLRNNLITVSSCKKHNSGIQELENEVRVFIVSASGTKNAQSIFFNKIQKDLNRKERKQRKEEFIRQYDPETNSFSLKKVNLISNFIKYIVNGLYYHHYNEVLYGRFRTLCNKLSDQMSHYKKAKYEVFNKYNFIQGKTLNKKIFDYKYFISNNYIYWWCCFYEQFETITIIKKRKGILHRFKLLSISLYNLLLSWIK